MTNIYRTFRRMRKTYANALFVMWNLFQKKEAINITFRDGISAKLSPNLVYLFPLLTENGIELDKAKDIFQNNKFTSLEMDWLLDLVSKDAELSTAIDVIKRARGFQQNEKITYKNKDIVIHGLKDNGDLIDVFVLEDYKFLNIDNETVIDVGANIGDSAIYFALNGAKKVIALEPYPYSFKLAKRNVMENNLENKIEVLNAGYGKDGEISIDENEKSGLGTKLKPSGAGEKIKIYSLKSLVKQFNLDRAVLKMDCEGCEYNILNEDISVLAKFPQMQIEFHNGYKKLVKKLKTVGFQVKYVNSRGSETFGYIYANRLKQQ